MRKVITPGEKVYAYCCPFCCQVEILTESEAHKECSNCGTVMIAAEEISTKEVELVIVEGKNVLPLERVPEGNIVPPPPAKIVGRPPEWAAEKKAEPPSPPPEETPPAPAPKKKGRPPKRAAEDKSQRTGDQERCGNCCKAMKAMRDYTCKETCEAVRPGDWCEKYKRGTPID